MLVNVHCLPLRSIVDGEIAALEADLGEVAAIEAARRRDSRSRRAARRDRERRRAWSGAAAAGTRVAAGTTRVIAAARSRFADARADAATAGLEAAEAVTNGRLLLPAKIVTVLSDSMRTAISAPTRLSRSARMRPVNRPAAGDADFGFRRARDDGAVRVAHHDVANAQRHAAVGVALELGAANLDLVAAAEIFLDRRGQPRRRDIELDRAAGQAPPQRDHREQDQTAERGAAKRRACAGAASVAFASRRRKAARSGRSAARAVPPATSSSAEVGASRWHKCRWRLASSLRRASRLE